MELGIGELLQLVCRYISLLLTVAFLRLLASAVLCSSLYLHGYGLVFISAVVSPYDVRYDIPSCILSLLQEKGMRRGSEKDITERYFYTIILDYDERD